MRRAEYAADVLKLGGVPSTAEAGEKCLQVDAECHERHDGAKKRVTPACRPRRPLHTHGFRASPCRRHEQRARCQSAAVWRESYARPPWSVSHCSRSKVLDTTFPVSGKPLSER